MENKNIKTTVEELRKLINIDNVVGSPIETDDKILIPVMRMGVGFGTGEGFGQNNANAAGAGAGVEPICMVILPKTGSSAEGIRVVNLTKGNDLNKALSDLGLVVGDLIKDIIDKRKEDDDYDEGEYIEPTTAKTVDVEIKDE